MLALALLPFAVVLYLLGIKTLAVLVDDRKAERDLKRDLCEKKLRFRETEAKRKAELPYDHSIPEDLMQRINAWDDEFGKQDEERTIRVLYAELKDWDKVRRNLPNYALRSA